MHMCLSVCMRVCVCALDKTPNGAGSWFVAQCYDNICITLACSDIIAIAIGTIGYLYLNGMLMSP